MIELGTKWPNTTTIGKLRVEQMNLAMCVVYEILKWPPLIIIGCVTYAPLSGVYECPLCSHGPRGPVGV